MARLARLLVNRCRQLTVEIDGLTKEITTLAAMNRPGFSGGSVWRDRASG